MTDNADEGETAADNPPGSTPHHSSRWTEAMAGLIEVIKNGDDETVERAVLELSRSRRLFAPLALMIGAFAMLLEGVRLLLSNWRLTLVEILPAMWIWLAMFDLKFHVFHGKGFHHLSGFSLVTAMIGIAVVTVIGFFLNAVFAFAVATPGAPEIRAAFGAARPYLWRISVWGLAVGSALAVSTMVSTRWGPPWFAVSLSVVVAVMMIAYVSVPSRILGLKGSRPTRDAVSAAAVGGAIGAVVCAPPYLLGRIGLLMLGSHLLFIPGVALVVVGVILQSGATGAVKAVKISAKLVAGRESPALSEADPL